VSAAPVERAPAKINLTLRVLGRRADGYHELESLVAFAGLADTLSLQPADAVSLDISGPFAAACGPPAGNLVLKAAAALRERVGGLKAGHFRLDKTIPVAGGLGGGSADAAAALRLLARLNGLAVHDPRLADAALAVGADVPVCLDPRPRIMRGIGEKLSPPVGLPRLAAVLVNPGVPLATRDVFAAFAGTPKSKDSLGVVPRDMDGLIAFLRRHDNDLTEAAIARAPAVAEVLEVLHVLPGLLLARMSGSGPTCFALFASESEVSAAAQHLRTERNDWWVHGGRIGGP